MKNKFLIISFISLILSGCIGVSSKGIFGTGVSVAFDPRSVGTQIDDSIMQKNLTARMLLSNSPLKTVFQIRKFENIFPSFCITSLAASGPRIITESRLGTLTRNIEPYFLYLRFIMPCILLVKP